MGLACPSTWPISSRAMPSLSLSLESRSPDLFTKDTSYLLRPWAVWHWPYHLFKKDRFAVQLNLHSCFNYTIPFFIYYFFPGVTFEDGSKTYLACTQKSVEGPTYVPGVPGYLWGSAPATLWAQPLHAVPRWHAQTSSFRSTILLSQL